MIPRRQRDDLLIFIAHHRAPKVCCNPIQSHPRRANTFQNPATMLAAYGSRFEHDTPQYHAASMLDRCELSHTYGTQFGMAEGWNSRSTASIYAHMDCADDVRFRTPDTNRRGGDML